MKKYIIPAIIVLILLLGGGIYTIYHFVAGTPWQGTRWGVQEAGVNWSGDHIRNLETVTFTKNEDNTITVVHRVQNGSKEIEGSLSGTGKIDGGRLIVTPKDGGRDKVFSYHTVSKTIETPLTHENGDPVVLESLTEANNEQMENIRSEIVKTSQKPENKIDTTLSASRS